MIDFLRSLCIPSFCYYCHSYDAIVEPVCSNCFNFSPVLSTALQIGIDDFLVVYTLSLYEDPLKALLTKRFNNDYVFWSKMGTLLYQSYSEYFSEGDLLIPLPDDSSSELGCGFRKIAVMVHQVSMLSGTAFADLLSFKAEKKRPFSSTPEWYEYVKNELTIGPLPPHKRCILVDSRMVTGATLATVARMLRKKTSAPIAALVLCRVERPILS